MEHDNSMISEFREGGGWGRYPSFPPLNETATCKMSIMSVRVSTGRFVARR